MARDFTGTKRISNTGGSGFGINGHPYTMFARGRRASTTTEGYSLAWCPTAGGIISGDSIAIGYKGDSGVLMRQRFVNGSGGGEYQGSVVYSANTWYAVTGVGSGTTSHDGWGDQTKASSATSLAWLAHPPDSMSIGCFSVASGGALSFSAYLEGMACSAAIWATALTDDEIKCLAKGFSPRRVRPQSLRFYAPLVRNVQDVIGAIALTDNGSVAYDHPRAYGF